jgi:hypothetical protein
MRKTGHAVAGLFLALHNDCNDAAIITMKPQSGMDEGGETITLMQNSGS